MAMTSTLARRLTDDPIFRNFRNFSIGFDPMLESLLADNPSQGYPPYNIIQTSPGNFRIEVALAGFKKKDVLVEADGNLLTISRAKDSCPNVELDSKRLDSSEDGKTCGATPAEYIHRGISGRNFSLRFRLAEQVMVTEAKMEDGILTVKLLEKPKESSTKYIEIK